MTKNLYDIYENGQKIKTGLMAGDVTEFANLSKGADLRPYHIRKYKLCGKYDLVLTGQAQAASRGYKPANGQLAKFTPEMYRKWTNMNRRYGKRWQNG